MSRKVLLHVGTPKTGTSYLQDVLFRNREVLAGRRHRLPGQPPRQPLPRRARPDAAAVGRAAVRGDRRLGRAGRARSARRTAGTAIISHEILATASRAQIGRALESLGHRAGATAPRSTSCCPCATWSARSPRSGRRTSSTAPS